MTQRQFEITKAATFAETAAAAEITEIAEHAAETAVSAEPASAEPVEPPSPEPPSSAMLAAIDAAVEVARHAVRVGDLLALRRVATGRVTQQRFLRAVVGAVVELGRAVGADDYVEQSLYDLEQARQHLGCGEVLLDLLLAEGVARLLEFFADKWPVPGLRVGNSQLL